MDLLCVVDKLAGRWFDWRMNKFARWNKEPVEIVSVDIEKSGVEIIMEHSGIAYLADQCSEILIENNAENYVQFDLFPRLDRGKPPIRVTIQWAHGISPAVKAARLAIEVEKIKTDLENTLIDLYKLGNMPVSVAVAELCDEKLDRSGRLLGQIRNKAKECKNDYRS